MTTRLESRVKMKGPHVEAAGGLCESKDERIDNIIQRSIARSETLTAPATVLSAHPWLIGCTSSVLACGNRVVPS